MKVRQESTEQTVTQYIVYIGEISGILLAACLKVN